MSPGKHNLISLPCRLHTDTVHSFVFNMWSLLNLKPIAWLVLVPDTVQSLFLIYEVVLLVTPASAVVPWIIWWHLDAFS
jgi:hypothetical protein